MVRELQKRRGHKKKMENDEIKDGKGGRVIGKEGGDVMGVQGCWRCGRGRRN